MLQAKPLPAKVPEHVRPSLRVPPSVGALDVIDVIAPGALAQGLLQARSERWVFEKKKVCNTQINIAKG